MKRIPDHFLTEITNKLETVFHSPKTIWIGIFTTVVSGVVVGLILWFIIPSKNEGIKIEKSPGSIATKNQQGNNFIVNPIEKIPEAKIIREDLSLNEPFNESFKSQIKLTVDTKIPVPNLYLEARGNSIVSMEIDNYRTGIFMLGNSGTRDGYAFSNIPNANGPYLITILTKKKEIIEIRCNKSG